MFKLRSEKYIGLWIGKEVIQEVPGRRNREGLYSKALRLLRALLYLGGGCGVRPGRALSTIIEV